MASCHRYLAVYVATGFFVSSLLVGIWILSIALNCLHDYHLMGRIAQFHETIQPELGASASARLSELATSRNQ